MVCSECKKEIGWLNFGDGQCFGCYMGVRRTVSAQTPKNTQPIQSPVTKRGQAVMELEAGQ